MINPATLRTKLKNGSSIESVCKEYNLTFNDLFKLLKKGTDLPRGPNPEASCSTGELYITKRTKGRKRYFLRKNDVFYGSYSSLEDAKKVRDYFIMHRWDKRKLDEVCKKVGVKRVMLKKGRG